MNLYGFWDEHSFLTKSGDLGAALRIGGIDYESLDHAGRDHAVKRVEAAFRSLDDKCRLYQILFKRNHPAIPHAEYEDPLVRAAVEQRADFLQSKSDRLYSIELYWVVMIDGKPPEDRTIECAGAVAETATLVAPRLARPVLRQ